MKLLTCIFVVFAGVAAAEQQAAPPGPANIPKPVKKANPARPGMPAQTVKPAVPVQTAKPAIPVKARPAIPPKTAKPTQPAAKAPVKKLPAASAVTIPADAVQTEAGLFRWTDKDGKVWLYRKTPFGVKRWEDDNKNAKQESVVDETSATDQGDSIRFQRTSPFGTRAWVRKKSELDETERKIWAARQDKGVPTAAKAEKEQ
ncbi:MAG: hypothetical protein U0Q18_18980 [Bryobacteraceae bacterium]